MRGEALRRRWGIILGAAAIVWALGFFLAAFTAAAYRHSDGTTTTLVEENGHWVLVPVALPAVTAALVCLLLYRRRRRGEHLAGRVAWLGIALLFGFALLTIATIGQLVLPVALLLGGAAVLTRPPRAARPAP